MTENEIINPDDLKVQQLATKPAEEVIENELNEEDSLNNEELSDEELKEIYIKQLKASKIKFHPLKHPIKKEIVGKKTKFKLGSYIRTEDEINASVQTNIIENQFGVKHRKKRNRKNKLTKTSRRANRKK